MLRTSPRRTIGAGPQEGVRLRACLHGRGGPQVGEVTRLSIIILTGSRLHDRWGDLLHVTSPIWDPPLSCKQALRGKEVDTSSTKSGIIRSVVSLSCNEGKEIYKKSVMHVQSCCFAHLNRSNVLLLCRSRCRQRHRCLSSLLALKRCAKGTQ